MHIYTIDYGHPMKSSDASSMTNDADSPNNCQDEVVFGVLNQLLVPLARLCLANGITFSAVQDVLKRAFVLETVALQPNAPMHGTVSRVSTATGINRREVTRLINIEAPDRQAKPPIAAEIFARWTTDAAWRDHDGTPRVLNRQGASPSFEALAQSITRDVHPRSMLEELIRLDLVHHDEVLDQVSLTRSDFVPKGDTRQMVGFLGDNVGDHLDAAVDNVLHDGSRHLEQAVFADELSGESIEALRPLIMAQWQALRDALVPAITAFIEADRLAGRAQDRRVRVGLYSYAEATQPNEALSNAPTASRKANNKGKNK